MFRASCGVFSTLLTLAILFAWPGSLLGDPPTIASAIKFRIVPRPLVSHRVLEQAQSGERPPLELVIDKRELYLLEKLLELNAAPNLKSDSLYAERIATVERLLAAHRSSNPTGFDAEEIPICRLRPFSPVD